MCRHLRIFLENPFASEVNIKQFISLHEQANGHTPFERLENFI